MNLTIFLALYVLALVYGSLVPFVFANRTLAEALRFLDAPLPATATAFANADFGMNVILYVPLGALTVLTLLTRGEKPDATTPAGKRVLVALVATVCATALSFAIEATQGFVMFRQASLQDVVANALGGALGAALAAAFEPALARGLAALRIGGSSAWRPVAAAGLAAFLLFSFYPFDFVGGMQAWHAKVAAGRNSAVLAAATCSSMSGCAPGLVLETVVAAILAALVNLRFPLGPSLVRWTATGVLVGGIVELVQSGLASGIAQGASVVTRGIGFFATGLLVNHLQPHHVDRARRHPGLLALGMAMIASVGILLVNRIRIPFAAASEPLATRLESVEWLPFRYAIDVGEGRAALSIVAQMSVYAMLGTAFWLASLGRRRIPAFLGAALATVVALAVEGAKLFMAGRHPDPADILLAPLACGATIALLQHLFTPTGPESSIMQADSDAALRRAAHSGDAAPIGPAVRGVSPTVEESTDTVGWPTRAMAVALFVVATANAYALPRFNLCALLIACLAAALVAWRRDFWLITLPFALPVFDLTHWTGRMFWTEFDSLCAAMLAVLWWRNGLTCGIRWLQLPAWLTMLGLALWMLAGAFVAGWPLPLPARANLDSYFSPYVGFYSLKGIGWALLFYPFAARAFAVDRERAMRWFATGMTAGLTATTLFIFWERVTFPGLFNLAHEYRVTGPFSVMHVGGAYIEGYLVGALPFAALFIVRNGANLRGAAAAALLAGGTFALLITHSREAYMALAIAALVFVLPLLFAGIGGRHSRARQIFAALVVTVILAGGLLTLGKGHTIQHRFASIASDVELRLDHWARSLRMLGSHPVRWVTGIGPGHYAAAYYWQPDAKDVPGRIVFMTDGMDTFARMGTGTSIHLSQAVDVIADQRYVITARIRSNEAQAHFTIPLCEKWLLDSFGCARRTFTINATAGQWTMVRWEFDTHELRYAVPWVGRPVKLSLRNPNASAYVDVTDVSLRDALGVELARNGTFSAGTDNWVPTTDSHLAWHAKTLPLHLLVELGLVGLALFSLLAARAIIAAVRGALAGDMFAVTVLAALAGMLTVGLTDSLIDAPRIATLFFLLLAMGLLTNHVIRPMSRGS